MKFGVQTLTRVTRGTVLVVRLSKEVAGYKAAHAVDLRHVEPVVVHLAVNVNYLTRLEAKLRLKRTIT